MTDAPVQAQAEVDITDLTQEQIQTMQRGEITALCQWINAREAANRRIQSVAVTVVAAMTMRAVGMNKRQWLEIAKAAWLDSAPASPVTLVPEPDDADAP